MDTTLAERSQNANVVLIQETFVTCQAVDCSQLRSNGHQWIHTGHLQDAERMRTGQNM